MVAYKITFDQNRNAVLTDTDEAPSKTWKKGVVRDEIIITASGRSNWSRPFKNHITYKLSDFAVTSRRIIPLEIITLYESHESIATDVGIELPVFRRYSIRANIQEILDAVALADKQYTTLGGGITTVKEPLHKNPLLLEKLRKQLEVVTSKQK